MCVEGRGGTNKTGPSEEKAAVVSCERHLLLFSSWLRASSSTSPISF